MILICGIPTEPPLARAIAAAEALGLEHVVLNQRHVHFDDLVLDVRGGAPTGSLWMWEREYPLERFSGVYTRLIDNRDIPENTPSAHSIPDATRVARAAFLHTVFNDWLEIAECAVLNRTSAMASNASKPFQAQLIIQTGLRTPETLISNDPDEIRAFRRSHGRVIYKSTSSVRSIVRELTPELSDESLDRVHGLPTQFQEFIDGHNVRVHVVGDSVFASEVATTAIDYRYAHQDNVDVAMTAVELPARVADQCRALSRLLDLPLCGIDLKRTADGTFFCFEVNPSPAYSYFQEHTGQPIAEAIVRLLAGGGASPER
jgi:glutathione synthase/RimK-type ligase-like ATP-grasp enzyme